MKILILGSGGREHAIAWKVSRSPLCKQLFVAPGNAGTEQNATNVALDPSNFEQVKAFLKERGIDMLIVGPEVPLVAGIRDVILAEPGLENIALIGPDREGAMLEGSKAYAKKFMQQYGIPTAAYKEFDKQQAGQALKYLGGCDTPIVLKADGLAAGKGVVICQSREEAKMELKEMFGGKFGEASERVVIEQFLEGREFSVFVLTDGKDYRILPQAKDYKRVGEGDHGLNTGGMGSVSPVPFADERMMEKVVERIIKPTMRGIAESGFTYKGFIFFGLIESGGEPRVIEYNCRMGDPETQVVLPRIKSDLLVLLKALHEGKLAECELEEDPRAAATVIMASGGYPVGYEKGKEISGLENVEGSIVFHAGTKREDGRILTNGGRVLAVTSLADDLQSALKQSYRSIGSISFDRQYFRRDIGFDL